MNEIEMKRFQEMISKYDKAFASLLNKIGYVNSKVVVSIVVFTILYVLLNLKPILILKAFLSKLMSLLKKRCE